MRHSQKPYQASADQAALAEAKMKEIMASEYYQHVVPLKEKVVGKIISKSLAGTSGFALFFPDDEWMVAYLRDMRLTWDMGKGEISQELQAVMNSTEYRNGSHPLSVDRPYAKEVCDIGSEIANAHGKQITSLSFGARSFNFCFSDGKELDTSIVPTVDQKYALRVFWEQW